MPKYWGKQIFAHGSGLKAKDGEKKKERRRRLTIRSNVHKSQESIESTGTFSSDESVESSTSFKMDEE